MSEGPAPEQGAFDLAAFDPVEADRAAVPPSHGTASGRTQGGRTPPRHTPDRLVRVAPDGPGRRSPTATPTQPTDEELAILGLCPGEAVRWQSGTGSRWQAGSVSRRERDGSIGVVDARGASRSLPVERLYVRCAGPRGGVAWEPLTERAGRSEQLCLLDTPALRR